MFINKVKKLEYALFQGFKWSSDLDSLVKRNIFFGWNGTGKTTLSRVFRSIESGVLPNYEGASPVFSIEIKDEPDITNSNIKESPYIRVFNQDFIDDVVFRSEDNGGTPYIYYIGEKKAALEAELLELEKDLVTKRSDKNKFSAKIESLEREKRTTSSERASVIKNSVSTGGDHPFNVFDATRFNGEYESIEKRLKEDKSLTVLSLKLTEQQISDKKQQIENSQQLESLSYRLSSLSTATKEESLEQINQLFEKIVEDRKIIDRLENDKKINAWVKDGFDIHNEENLHICQFCEQKLPHNHLNKLSNYFSKEFTELINSIDQAIEKINTIDTKEIKDTDILGHLTKLNEIIIDFHNYVENKKDNTDKIIPRDEELESKLVKKIDETKKHLGDPKEHIKNIKNRLVTAYVADIFEDYKKLIDGIKINTDEEKEIVKEIKDIEDRIIEIKTEIEDVQIPLKEINLNLNFILGHGELTLISDDKTNGYKIFRDDAKEARILSEGEKTAIAVAYFVARINEKDFDKKHGVVVFDDPISSLDSNALYSIYALIVDAVEDVPQTIVLTHNLEFFNLLKKTYKKEKRNLYSVCIENNTSGKRSSLIKNVDPCLEKFESDYQYLFKLLYDFENKTDIKKEKIQNIYPYPNISRRFLETYLSFKSPSATDFKGALDSRTNVDSKKRNKVYKFANAHSHGQASGLTGFASGVLVPDAKEVISLVLDIVRDDDIDHYKSLEKSIKHRAREGSN